MKLHDTIAAIATPVGSGGIAILRISGKDAQTILAKVGTAKNKKPVSLWESHKLTLCHIHPENREDQPLDQALAVIMRAPHSYTGEDVAEIHCHGGFFAANQILKHLLNAGARLAEPGEFTRRAFLNGKTSLNEAEAVMDLIDASSDLGLTNAARALNGALSAQLTALRERIMALTAHISAAADYPEEVDPPTREETAAQLRYHLDYWISCGEIQTEGDSYTFSGGSRTGQAAPHTHRPIHKAAELKKPSYTMAEIDAVAAKNKAISGMFYQAETILQKVLTQSDMELLYSFVDWLGLPVEVIVMLLSYAAKRGKCGRRYLEKMAMDWADRGIDTFEAAESYVMELEAYHSAEQKVRRVLGIHDRALTPTEKKYIKTCQASFMKIE